MVWKRFYFGKDQKFKLFQSFKFWSFSLKFWIFKTNKFVYLEIQILISVRKIYIIWWSNLISLKSLPGVSGMFNFLWKEVKSVPGKKIIQVFEVSETPIIIYKYYRIIWWGQFCYLKSFFQCDINLSKQPGWVNQMIKDF